MPPPLLVKLNELLSEASSQFGFSADLTQSVAQSLYEKKLITYPRTESRHLRAEDDVEAVRERLQRIMAALPSLAAPAAAAQDGRVVRIPKVIRGRYLLPAARPLRSASD